MYPCRWCGHEKKSEALDPLSGDVCCTVPGIGDFDKECVACGAVPMPAIQVAGHGPHTILLWHNPDNSLYIEFIEANGKTARYTLSTEILQKTGALALYDQPTEGRRNP